MSIVFARRRSVAGAALAVGVATVGVCLLALPWGTLHGQAARGRPASTATRPVSELLGELGDADPAVRGQTVAALAGRIPTLPAAMIADSVAPALAAALGRESDPRVRAATVALIAEVAAADTPRGAAMRAAVPAVVAVWQEDITRERQAGPSDDALLRLGSLAAADGVPSALAVLAEHCALKSATGASSYPGGVAFVDGVFVGTRCHRAVAVLGAVGRGDAGAHVPLLSPFLALQGTWAEVGSAAARALAGFGRDGEMALLAAARDGENPDRADQGIRGLAHVLSPEAAATLLAVVQDTAFRTGRNAVQARQEQVRQRAILTLGRYGPPLATPALAALAVEANAEPRRGDIYRGVTQRHALIAFRALRAGTALSRTIPVLGEPPMMETVGPLP